MGGRCQGSNKDGTVGAAMGTRAAPVRCVPGWPAHFARVISSFLPPPPQQHTSVQDHLMDENTKGPRDSELGGLALGPAHR